MKLRIIEDGYNSAAFNMAADHYLLSLATQDPSTVYLRFYFWKNPSVTIGYTQKAADNLDLEYLHRVGGEWIRRPTGGRAVLHFEDITYSIVFNRMIKSMGMSISESYSLITRCLIHGLKQVGIVCGAHDSYDDLMDVKRQVKLPCFLAPNRDEVMVQGKKLVGSAQKRTSQAVLQHGSLPLTPAYRDLPDYLLIDSGEKKRQRELLAHKSICINEIDPALRFDLLVNALKDGFLTLPGIIPAEQGWTDLEKIEIYSIVTSNEFQQQWCN